MSENNIKSSPKRKLIGEFQLPMMKPETISQLLHDGKPGVFPNQLGQIHVRELITLGLRAVTFGLRIPSKYGMQVVEVLLPRGQQCR